LHAAEAPSAATGKGSYAGSYDADYYYYTDEHDLEDFELELEVIKGTNSEIFNQDQEANFRPLSTALDDLGRSRRLAAVVGAGTKAGRRLHGDVDGDPDHRHLLRNQDYYTAHSRLELTEAKRETCATGLGGGTPFGAKCVFPFKFKGTSYSHCTSTDNGDMEWCATKVDENAEYVHGMWGECIEMWDCTSAAEWEADPSYYYEKWAGHGDPHKYLDRTKGLTDPFEIVEYPSLRHYNTLTECYDWCERIKGCNIYSFNNNLELCLLLGDGTVHGMMSGCSVLGEFSAEDSKLVKQLAELGYSGPPQKAGDDAPQWIKDIMSAFRVFMITDTPWLLFGEEKQDVKCVCMDGYDGESDSTFLFSQQS
jgi:hypothetical protein